MFRFYLTILVLAVITTHLKSTSFTPALMGQIGFNLISDRSMDSDTAMHDFHRADSALYQLKYGQAIFYYKNALKIIENRLLSTTDSMTWFTYASILFNIGFTYQLSGQNDSSIVYLLKCQEVIVEKSFEKTALHALCLFRLKQCYSFLGNRLKQKELYQRAIELGLSLFGENDLFLGMTYHQMGYHYYLMNDFEKMSFFFQKVELIFDRISHYKNIYYSKGLPLAHQSPNSLISDFSYYATRYYFESCYNNIILKRMQVAWYHFKKAEENYNLNPGINPSMPFRLKYLRSSFLTQEGKYEESLKLTDTLIELTKNKPDVYIFIDAYEAKTLNYEKMGDFENAFKTMERCFNLYQPKGDNGIQIYMRTRKAELALKSGRFELCLALCDTGMYTVLHRFPGYKELTELNWQDYTIGQIKCMHDLLQYKFQVLCENVLTSKDTTQLLELEKLFTKIHEGTILLHTKVLSDHNRLIHELENYPLTEKAILINHQLNEISSNSQYLLNSLKWSEISKIVLLTQELELDQRNKKSALNIQLHKIRDQERRIKSDELKLKEFEMDRGVEHSIYKNQLLNNVLNSSADLELLKEIYSEALEPVISSRLGKNYPIQEIQAKLNNTESVLLDYFFGENTIVIHMISSDTIVEKVVEKTKLFQSSLYLLIEYLKNPESPQDSLDHVAGILAKYLLPPSILFKGIRHVVIIPDGILNFIPFELLFSNLQVHPTVRYEYSSNLFLNDKKETKVTRYVGFAPEYKGTEPIRQTRGDSILLGEFYDDNRAGMGPLKFNIPEVTESAQILKGKSFTGDHLSEKVFRDNAENAGIIHLALHALADDQNPDYSQFIFKSGDNENAYDPLYAFELNKYNLHANLAILSACNTGAGKYQQGNGVLSLARAFKKAGCQNIIMSLWPVNDASTKDIVVGFIKYLKAGEGKADALAKSKKDYLRNAAPELKHPYYWAGLVLIGDNEKMIFNTIDWKWIVLGILGFTALILFWANYFQHRKYLNQSQSVSEPT